MFGAPGNKNVNLEVTRAVLKARLFLCSNIYLFISKLGTFWQGFSNNVKLSVLGAK